MAPLSNLLLIRLPKTLLRNPVLFRVNNNVRASGYSSVAVNVVNGKFDNLPKIVQDYIHEKSAICQPDNIHICDGTEQENQQFLEEMVKAGEIKKLPKYDNCWLANTDPRDVARVESKTVIITDKKEDTIPTPKEGVTGTLGHWMSPEDLDVELGKRFPGSMKGRTMFVIPFSMGPTGGSISKYGVQLTDSRYVVASMRVMTRISPAVFDLIDKNNEFVKCLHTVGCPLPLKRELVRNWPCDPDNVLVTHIPAKTEIISYGSGYGGNSLLGKKCFALRIGSTIAKKEGWLAEHMLILGITNPEGKKKYIAAAFPSACGKTNLAMMDPGLPGWKVECVGDDIAWLKFNKKGKLHAINPENGFFGVAPGTSAKSNPNALKACMSNTVFTNVAETGDGGVYWEGMGEEPVQPVTSWLNEPWTKDSGKLAAHANSRFCAPAAQCPTIDPNWENEDGVPIDAIVFGGRRPKGVPLVYEAFNWQHGVFVGASMRSEATAAAEHKSKAIMHDPFAMRPFFGYNFGHYLSHWLSMDKPERDMPKVFHVNWFRKNDAGKFMWPGFGENARVLEWVFNRTEANPCAESVTNSAVGILPTAGAINTSGLDGFEDPSALADCFSIDQKFWNDEIEAIRKYFDEQLQTDLPKEIGDELDSLADRVGKM